MYFFYRCQNIHYIHHSSLNCFLKIPRQLYLIICDSLFNNNKQEVS